MENSKPTLLKRKIRLLAIIPIICMGNISSEDLSARGVAHTELIDESRTPYGELKSSLDSLTYYTQELVKFKTKGENEQDK